MAFILVMVGVFCFIYMSPPIFKKIVYDYTYLLIVLVLLSVIIINGSFINIMSDGLLGTLTLTVLSPLYIKTFSVISNRETEH